MMREVLYFLLSASALAAFAQVAVADAPVGGPGVAHGEVGHDYLLKVCEYVVREKLPVTAGTPRRRRWYIFRSPSTGVGSILLSARCPRRSAAQMQT